MKILAIDPGPKQSAYVLWNGETCLEAKIIVNEVIRELLENGDYEQCAIEMVACFGMPVGREVFETCLEIGRFTQCAGRMHGEPKLIYRRDIKHHFCNNAKAKDANIRQAILDRFGGKEAAVGKKANPGPLYGIKSHLWSALAISLYIQDQNKTLRCKCGAPLHKITGGGEYFTKLPRSCLGLHAENLRV